MSGKYYAVKIGRQAGIYTSWNDCQQQINGFSGALYKSFSSEYDATNFIIDANSNNVIIGANNNNNQLNKNNVNNSIIGVNSNNVNVISKKIIEIYTDGSFKKKSGYQGFGAYCNYQNNEYTLAGNITSELLMKYNITSDTTISNPSIEFIGFAEVIMLFYNKFTIREDGGELLLQNLSLKFYIDYIGVGRWIDGSWQAKQPYIKSIRDKCLSMMADLKAIGCNIEIIHIKGHNGNEFNDKADVLAKCETEHNTFNNIFYFL